MGVSVLLWTYWNKGCHNGAFGGPVKAELDARLAELPGTFPEECASCFWGSYTLSDDQLPPGQGESRYSLTFTFYLLLLLLTKEEAVKELTASLHPLPLKDSSDWRGLSKNREESGKSWPLSGPLKVSPSWQWRPSLPSQESSWEMLLSENLPSLTSVFPFLPLLLPLPSTATSLQG